jgi:hypothetical protein
MVRNVRKIILMLVCIVGVIFIVKVIVRVIQVVKTSDRDLEKIRIDSTSGMPSFDSAVIAEKFRRRLKVIEFIGIEGRPSISMYKLDNKYVLVVSKIGLSRDMSIKDLVNNSVRYLETTTMNGYFISDFNDWTVFRINDHAVPPVSKILLSYGGDSLTSTINDSVFYYHLLCRRLTVRYGETAPVDLFVGGSEGLLGIRKKGPLDLLLLKRASSVYLMFLSPDDPDLDIDPHELLDMVSAPLAK